MHSRLHSRSNVYLEPESGIWRWEEKEGPGEGHMWRETEMGVSCLTCNVTYHAAWKLERVCAVLISGIMQYTYFYLPNARKGARSL
jgi:hypothetical protein